MNESSDKQYLALFTNGRYAILQARSEQEALLMAKSSAEQSKTRVLEVTDYTPEKENRLLVEVLNG